MRQTTLALLLAFAPGYLAAQSQNPGQTGSTPATQPAPQSSPGFSAETRARLEVMFAVARQKQVPTDPMSNRIAEGQAKGASDAQIIAATQQLEARLEASQQALIQAGRPQPSAQEITAGAQLIASGASSAQLEAIIRHNPSERRLDLALEGLAGLTAQGVSVEQALRSGVSSGQSGTTSTGGTGSSGTVSVSTTAQSAGSASIGAGKAAMGSSLSGTLTGSLGAGLIRKP